MFLDLNAIDVTVMSNDDVFELVMSIAVGGIDLEEIARQLESLTGAASVNDAQ